MANDTPQQISVESTIRLDYQQRLVTLTPKTVNGIAVLDPIAAVVTMDQLIGIVCQILQADLEAKQQHLTQKVQPGMLIFPGSKG